MYLRNSKSFIPTQAVPIPRGRPQGRPQGICDPPGCRTFCQVVQSGGSLGHCRKAIPYLEDGWRMAST